MKKIFLLCSVSIVVTGCAEFYGYQTPAPVYGSNTPVYGNKPLPQTPIDSSAKTEPLKNDTVITPQPLPAGEKILTPAQEQELSHLEKTDSSLTTQQQHELDDFQRKLDAMMAEQDKPKPKPKVENTKLIEETVVETAPSVPVVEQQLPTPARFEPLESFSQMSPAVNSLVVAANEDSQKGNEDAASSTLERASRIEPRNAALYYKMALLKLKNNPSAAENLAKKSAILAGTDTALKKHSWLLVAKARELQKNQAGAQEARDKANKF